MQILHAKFFWRNFSKSRILHLQSWTCNLTKKGHPIGRAPARVSDRRNGVLFWLQRRTTPGRPRNPLESALKIPDSVRGGSFCSSNFVKKLQVKVSSFTIAEKTFHFLKRWRYVIPPARGRPIGCPERKSPYDRYSWDSPAIVTIAEKIFSYCKTAEAKSKNRNKIWNFIRSSRLLYISYIYLSDSRFWVHF